jgi:hypothetical protein
VLKSPHGEIIFTAWFFDITFAAFYAVEREKGKLRRSDIFIVIEPNKSLSPDRGDIFWFISR